MAYPNFRHTGSPGISNWPWKTKRELRRDPTRRANQIRVGPSGTLGISGAVALTARWMPSLLFDGD